MVRPRYALLEVLAWIGLILQVALFLFVAYLLMEVRELRLEQRLLEVDVEVLEKHHPEE